jgi:hypothetical protein
MGQDDRRWRLASETVMVATEVVAMAMTTTVVLHAIL